VTTSPDQAEIQVEFYGTARQRTGTAAIRLAAPQSLTLQTLWRHLMERFPALEADESGYRPPSPLYRVNLDGQRFVMDPRTRIEAGQAVLIMSADAGG
jgi:molybdopterin converting factor small subunit